jgi:hypothetical protein
MPWKIEEIGRGTPVLEVELEGVEICRRLDATGFERKETANHWGCGSKNYLVRKP